VSDKYCGIKNCYTLLNVTKDASEQEIKKAYRTLSVVWHPDKNPDFDTTEIFREIVQAYEIVGNKELRESYDEFLDHPERSEAYHYYKFYKARYSPQADPKVVMGLFLFLFSVFQWWNRKRMYENALAYLVTTNQFQTMVRQKYDELRAVNPNSTKTRDELANELKYTVNVHGGYAAPKLTDLIGVQFVLIPYYILKYAWFNLRWLVKFTILRRPYGDVERSYLTRKQLRLSEEKWKLQDPETAQMLINLELWKPENFLAYLKSMEEQRQETYGDSGKYKQYKRYMKKKTRIRMRVSVCV